MSTLSRMFHPLRFFPALCTKKQLIRPIKSKKAETEVLRSGAPREYIRLTAPEREGLPSALTSAGTVTGGAGYFR